MVGESPGEIGDRDTSLGGACPDQSNAGPQAVTPVVIIPVDDFVQHVGIEAAPKAGHTHDREPDLAVLLPPEVDLREVVANKVS